MKFKKTEDGHILSFDIYGSGFVLLDGITPTFIPEEGTGYIGFAFPDSDEVVARFHEYYSGADVPARMFAGAVRTLRFKMFEAKHGQQKKGEEQHGQRE